MYHYRQDQRGRPGREAAGRGSQVLSVKNATHHVWVRDPTAARVLVDIAPVATEDYVDTQGQVSHLSPC